MLQSPSESNADGLVNYIKPVMDELLQLWRDGVTIRSSDPIIMAVLLCVLSSYQQHVNL